MTSPRRTWKQVSSCNVDRLVQLRLRRGWTQQALAHATGYSERLISKAESGRPISTAAIQTLAQALSTDKEPVAPEDLISDLVALARQFMAGVYVHQKNILPAIRHLLHDDVVFRLVGDPAALPFAGEHRGLAAVERLFDFFFSIAEVPPNHDHEAHYTYHVQNQEVIVSGLSWIHPIGVPLDKPIRVTHHLRFRAGKIACFDCVYDTLYVARLLAGGQAASDDE